MMTTIRLLPLLLVSLCFNAHGDVVAPKHLTASVTGVSTQAQALAIEKEIAQIAGVKEADIVLAGAGSTSVSVIFEESILSATAIQQALSTKGLTLKDVKVDDQSHCKSDCPHPCCSYPDRETGKCLCAAKGKDCSIMCCRSETVNKPASPAAHAH